MRWALEESGLAPSDIDFLLANGSGIPHEDRQEAHAIQSIFQGALRKLHVTAVKPITGHLVYGSGGVEAAAALLSLHKEVIPPIANLETPDPDCDLPFVKTKAIPLEAKAFLLNSFGFGGQNACLAVRKWSRD